MIAWQTAVGGSSGKAHRDTYTHRRGFDGVVLASG